ncbi:ImmA/IrrE family metallo-endopeptidase, partial [Crocinitomicaceae bacterium]|nr:ImmA/IrrE family metallo-endopeptidase [Crocinitomicaceae bacterium]
HIGMEKSQLNEIIKGKRDFNTELAILLETALGLEAMYWLNLQSQYNIDLARIDQSKSERLVAMTTIEECSSFIAIKYLRKQKVISGDPVSDIPVLSNIYGIENLGQIQHVFEAAQFARFRKSEKLAVDKVNLVGWVKYSEYVAKSITVKPFLESAWDSLKEELRTLFHRNENVHDTAQEILSEYGIKLLYQQKAEKAPIDGIAFWSGDNPSIAMTLRHKRLDNFAFTLFHELGHIFLHLKGDKTKEIIDLARNDEEFKTSKEELEANEFSRNNLIPADKWSSFKSMGEWYEEDVYEFANEINIHPSIVLGRLCFELDHYAIKTTIDKAIN